MGRGDKIPIIIPRHGDPSSATADERDEHLMLLESARHALDVEWTETLAAAEGAGDHDLFAYPSTVAYLKHRMRMAGSRANRYVKKARTAVAFRATLAAWKNRQISSDEAELLFRTAERNPDRYPQAEAGLLELVGDGYDDTRKILDYWSNRVDPEGVILDLEDPLARRYFHVTRKANGMVAGQFELPRGAGESLLTGLDALMPPPADGDSRTTAQRQADALEDLARRFLDGSETPMVGGEATNGGACRPPGPRRTSWRTTRNRGRRRPRRPHAETARLRCLRIEVCLWARAGSPRRRPQDQGDHCRPQACRRRPRPALHLAWCKRKPRWCDAHHIVSWADGGETVITNLCLLCRYHHTPTHLEITPEDEKQHPVLAGVGRRRCP